MCPTIWWPASRCSVSAAATILAFSSSGTMVSSFASSPAIVFSAVAIGAVSHLASVAASTSASSSGVSSVFFSALSTATS